MHSLSGDSKNSVCQPYSLVQSKCELCIVFEVKCISQLRFLQKYQKFDEQLEKRLAHVKEVLAESEKLEIEIGSSEKRRCYVL